MIRILLAGFVFCTGAFSALAGLVGHWDFEEGSGNVALDGSSNHLDGTINNATYTPGRIGKYALDFNGVNSCVYVPNNVLLSPASLGISLWFLSRGTHSDYIDILDKGHGQGSTPYFAGYVLQSPPNSQDFYAAYGNGAEFTTLPAGGSSLDGNWHFLVANLGQAGMSLYIDGELVASGLGNGPIAQNDSGLWIGSHRDLGRHFNGLIDDVRIYDTPLSQTDVSVLYGTVVPAVASLRIERTSQAVRLSWPIAAIDFNLESTSSLATPVTWLPVKDTPTISGLENVIELPLTEHTVFFRLHSRVVLR